MTIFADEKILTTYKLKKMIKTVLSTIVVLIMTFVTQAQNVNIPDANFKTFLLGKSSINTNADTEIQVSEAAAFTGTINCGAQNIADLTGIEAFTGLTQLICWGNQLTSVDISQNTALTFVNFEGFLGSSLDLSNNISLTHVYVGWNDSLSTLNLANGNNTNITHIGASSANNLSCVQVDNVAYSTTNWTGANFLFEAGVSFSLNCSTTGLNDLYATNNTIDVYPNPTSNQINFSVLTNVQLTSVTGQIIADKKNVNLLDLSDQPTGIYFLTLTNNNGQVVQRSKIVKE